MPLSKDEALKLSRRFEETEIEGLGSICLRKLTQAEIFRWRKLSVDLEAKKKEPVAGRLILALCVVDDQGNRWFPNKSNNDEGEYEAAMAASGHFDWDVANLISKKAFELNGFGDKKIEADAKNSEQTQQPSSGTN